MRSTIGVVKITKKDTINPNNKAIQPNMFVHTYLCSAYKYLVSERKRYEPKTASYHSMSAALYNLDRLIQKYWPSSKGYKETISTLEFENDNYLYLWYHAMTKACNRNNNPFPDMISVILFIRDLPICIPADKRNPVKTEDSKKPIKINPSYTDSYSKRCWVECLLEKLESARWCCKTAVEYHARIHDTKNYTIMANAYNKIEKVMTNICNYHSLNPNTYTVTMIGDLNRFEGNAGRECVSILNDVISEIMNLKVLETDWYKWIPITDVVYIEDLVKELTPIYYR